MNSEGLLLHTQVRLLFYVRVSECSITSPRRTCLVHVDECNLNAGITSCMSSWGDGGGRSGGLLQTPSSAPMTKSLERLEHCWKGVVADPACVMLCLVYCPFDSQRHACCCWSLQAMLSCVLVQILKSHPSSTSVCNGVQLITCTLHVQKRKFQQVLTRKQCVCVPWTLCQVQMQLVPL